MSENEKKETQILSCSQKERTQLFAEIIHMPPIDLSEAIERAGLGKNQRKPFKFAEILTVYKKNI